MYAFTAGGGMSPQRIDRSLPLPSDPMANVLDDCRVCQGTGMATLNPDEEPGSHICAPAEDRTCAPVRKAMEAST